MRHYYTNKSLRKLFNQLNKEYFRNNLKVAILKFEDDLEDDGVQCDGLCLSDEIYIEGRLKSSPCTVEITLLHEMVHLSGIEGHSFEFKSRINDLYKMGAYDTLL